MSVPPSAIDLLLFWFGPRPYTAAGVQQHSRLWFGDAGAPELIPQTDELLRERYGYAGPLRAVGDVLRDQLFYMLRCGFDSSVNWDTNTRSM